MKTTITILLSPLVMLGFIGGVVYFAIQAGFKGGMDKLAEFYAT